MAPLFGSGMSAASRRRDGLSGCIGSDCRLIRLRDHRAVLQNALVLAQTLVAGVEEGVTFPDRTADRPAEVIALQRSLVAGVGDERKLR